MPFAEKLLSFQAGGGLSPQDCRNGSDVFVVFDDP
jgi:hypothetical protein